MSEITRELIEVHNDKGINVLELGKVDDFELLKYEVSDIISTKSGSLVLEKGDKNFYREDDDIIPVGDDKKLYDQLHGGCRSFQLLRPSPGWHEDYSGLSPDADYTKWKFWDGDNYPALSKLIKSLPSCYNFCINGFLPHSKFTVHREPIIKRFRDKWVMICRFHIPVLTNDKCFNYVGDGLYHFKEGYKYLFNIAAKHDGRNESDKARYHILYDVIITEQVIDMLKNGTIISPDIAMDLEVNPNRDVKTPRFPEPPEELFIAKENPFTEI